MSFPHAIADGRYTLVEPLGVGGMATVFKARDQRLQVWRAIKILSPQYANRPSLKDRFEAEARTTALLEHRHIVRVYDVGRSNGQPFIVMELVTGGNLVDWVKDNGPMPPRMALQVTVQVCAGVSAAHAKRVVHRDIKPHNVLITADGTCLITDFGIARVGDDTDGLTRTGAVFGTWAYMAPEQRADAKKVDARADVYSLGATLYYLLTGRTPVDLFAAEKDPTVMEDIPEAIRPELVKATQYKKGDRHETVDQLAEALAALVEGLPPDPEETPPLARAATPPEQLRGGARAIPNAAGGVTLLPAEGEGEPHGTLVPGDASVRSVNLAEFAAAGIIQPLRQDDAPAEVDGELGANYLPLVTDVPPSTDLPGPSDEPLDDGPGLTDWADALDVPPADQVMVSQRVLLAVALTLLLMIALVVWVLVQGGRGSGSAVVEAPPVEAPPVEAPPVEAPPVEAPPVETPVETPPVEAPVEAPVKPPPDRPPPDVKIERPPAGPPTGTVVLSGDADEVRFVRDGRSLPAGKLPAGDYEIRARFLGGEPLPAGSVSVRAGQRVEVNCSTQFFLCKGPP